MNQKDAKTSKGKSGNEMSSSKKSTSSTNLDSTSSPITFSNPLIARKDSSIQEDSYDLYKQHSFSSRTCEGSLESLECKSLELLFTFEDSDNIDNSLQTSLHSSFKKDFVRLHSFVYKNQPALIRPVIFNEESKELEYTSSL